MATESVGFLLWKLHGNLKSYTKESKIKERKSSALWVIADSHFQDSLELKKIDIQGVPVLVCQTKLGDRDHRSKKILSKDPCPEMNRLASRRM